MNKIVIARTAVEIEALRPAWESLYASSPGATMFQSFAWNRLAVEHFGGREGPFVVYVQLGDGQALVPACIRKGTIKFLGDELFDYADILVEGGRRALCMAWQELERLDLPVRIHGIRQGSCLHEMLSESAAPFCAAPAVAGFLRAEEFQGQHSRSARAWRRLLNRGLSLHVCSGTPGIVRRIYQLKAAQRDAAASLFIDPCRIGFLTAAAELPSHPCEIFSLEDGGARVAALVTFLDRNTRRFYTTYYDREWAANSPGAALLFEATRLSLEQGLACDYMTGEQPYKMRLANEVVPLYGVDSSDARLGGESSEVTLTA